MINNDAATAREIELEHLAISIRDEHIEKEIGHAGLAGTAGGKSLMKRAIVESVGGFATALEAWKLKESAKRKRSSAYKFLKVLPNQTLIYLTARSLINALAKRQIGYRGFIQRLADEVLIATGATLLREKDKAEFANLTRLLNWQPKAYIRQRMAAEAFTNACIEVSASDQEKLAIGATLVEIFCSSTGLFEAKTVWKHSAHSNKVLVPTEKGEQWIKDALAANRAACPYHLPMVVPPIPWTTLTDGGYLLQHIHPVPLVRTKERLTHPALAKADLSRVMAAVNSIQETPWALNHPVLTVWKQLVGTGLAGCSSSEDFTIPDKLAEEDDGFVARQALRRDTFDAMRDNTAKRCVELQKISMADILENDEKLYFPHNLDFRGRIYPLAGRGAINPQGDDSGKALLRFAEGRALGEQGVAWLFIHAQNTWGNDKVSLNARVAATEENLDTYCGYAADPMGNTGWMAADKPFCFLATCFELLGYSIQGESYESHLPIALDGSCSGLQHFAGIMLDQRLAEAVNVVQMDAERSSDIYSTVSDSVAATLLPQTEDMAMYWKLLLERDLVKQPVMTLSYGVTQTGMRKQIQEQCKKFARKGRVEYKEGASGEAAGYLATCIHNALGDVAAAAFGVMDWLAEAAAAKSKTVDSLDGALSWVTPIGLPVVQEYYEYESQRFNVFVEGRELRFVQRTGAAAIKTAKQKQGAAPNFVHSMDASHLMLTVNACVEEGLDSFAMIHDSFATHACDTGVLFEVLRNEFCTMYQANVLQELYDGMPDAVKELLPPPPMRGKLDLEQVKESEFFFS